MSTWSPRPTFAAPTFFFSFSQFSWQIPKLFQLKAPIVESFALSVITFSNSTPGSHGTGFLPKRILKRRHRQCSFPETVFSRFLVHFLSKHFLLTPQTLPSIALFMPLGSSRFSIPSFFKTLAEKHNFLNQKLVFGFFYLQDFAQISWSTLFRFPLELKNEYLFLLNIVSGKVFSHIFSSCKNLWSFLTKQNYCPKFSPVNWYFFEFRTSEYYLRALKAA